MNANQKNLIKLVTSGIFLTLATITVTKNLHAKNAIQTHASILKATKEFLEKQYRGEDVSITTGNLDKRLYLKQCSTPLEIFWPMGKKQQGKITLGVKCNSTSPWKLYVPAQIKLYKQVLVASRNLPRNHKVSDNDFKLMRVDTSTIRFDYISDISEFRGYLLKRPLKSDDILRTNILNRPKLIKRGEKVILLAKSGSFEIKMPGLAMADGSEGETVKIRNISSKRIVEGIIISRGIVKVLL